MTGPVNNANFTTPVHREALEARETRDADARQDAAAKAESPTTAPVRDDSVTLTSRPVAPTADSSIQSSADARATLERVKQQLAENPAAAVAAHGNLDAQSAAGALRLAA